MATHAPASHRQRRHPSQALTFWNLAPHTTRSVQLRHRVKKPHVVDVVDCLRSYSSPFSPIRSCAYYVSDLASTKPLGSPLQRTVGVVFDSNPMKRSKCEP